MLLPKFYMNLAIVITKLRINLGIRPPEKWDDYGRNGWASPEYPSQVSLCFWKGFFFGWFGVFIKHAERRERVFA